MKYIRTYCVEDTLLGSGGMGRVMRGIRRDGIPVAIKEILPEFASDLEVRMRTKREVDLLDKLDNNGIVKVYDQFYENDNFYIVMEFVDGMNVEQYVSKNGPIPYQQALRYMVQILDAMQYVHDKQMVHRDMKPSNIMIRKDGRICLLDFGIAKDLSDTSGTGTLFGTILGSENYMSPEQASGYSIDHRADIYALGCVLHFMLTAHHPYPILATDFETRLNITMQAFPKLTDHSDAVFPDRLQTVIDRATDRNMLLRFQSCMEFKKELENMLQITNGGNENADVLVTVGREDCDIIVKDPLKRVSRHHLDITYKHFTGGRFFVIYDRSSNGTLVNGRRICKGDTENIPVKGQMPTVLLALDQKCELDWKRVQDLIEEKLKQHGINEQFDYTDNTTIISQSSLLNNKNNSSLTGWGKTTKSKKSLLDTFRSLFVKKALKK